MNTPSTSQSLASASAQEPRQEPSPEAPRANVADFLASRSAQLEASRSAEALRLEPSPQPVSFESICEVLLLAQRLGYQDNVRLFSAVNMGPRSDKVEREFEASVAALDMTKNMYKSVITEQPVSFESIRDVLLRARSLATDDFILNTNIRAQRGAPPTGEVAAAYEASRAAFKLVNNTYKSVMAAQSDFRVAMPAQEPQPVNFESIREVVQLSRSLASEDYFQHISAAVNSPTGPEFNAALERLKVSEKSARLADGAYQSLISAEADFRGTTVSLISGDTAGAEASAASSGAHIAQVAEKLERFSALVPQSKLFASALNALSKADQVAGRIETAVAMRVETFSAGLKAFAKRVADFGASIARMPAVVADTAKTAGVSTAVATVATGAKYMAAFRGLLSSVSSKIETAKESVKESAWSMIARAADVAARVENRIVSSVEVAATQGRSVVDTVATHGKAAVNVVATHGKAAVNVVATQGKAAVDTVATHGKAAVNAVSTHGQAAIGVGQTAGYAAIGLGHATMGIAGGLLGSIGRAVKTEYVAQVEQVEAAKAVRRATPR